MRLKELNDQLEGKSIEERLSALAGIFSERIIFTTSFGIEDQVITHKIFTEKPANKSCNSRYGKIIS